LSCRILAMNGLLKETTGHVSARIPGTNEMFIRGRCDEETGLLFTGEAEVLRVDFDGNGVALDAPVTTPNELPIHGEIYKARPAGGCLGHAHPPATLPCGITGVDPAPMFAPFAPAAITFALDAVPVFRPATTPPRPEDVWPMIELMRGKEVCLMRGHGITVTGTTIEQATVRAIKLETLA